MKLRALNHMTAVVDRETPLGTPQTGTLQYVFNGRMFDISFLYIYRFDLLRLFSVTRIT